MNVGAVAGGAGAHPHYGQREPVGGAGSGAGAAPSPLGLRGHRLHIGCGPFARSPRQLPPMKPDNEARGHSRALMLPRMCRIHNTGCSLATAIISEPGTSKIHWLRQAGWTWRAGRLRAQLGTPSHTAPLRPKAPTRTKGRSLIRRCSLPSFSWIIRTNFG